MVVVLVTVRVLGTSVVVAFGITTVSPSEISSQISSSSGISRDSIFLL
jgi:hypothetical protein